jgi:UDP-N-acetylglucosamine transferase subunit ALG13
LIFVTVGTQLAFDRLIAAMDGWAAANPAEEVFAQTGPSSLPIRSMGHAEFIPPDKADDLFRKASLIVSHAGMGSILTAFKYRKPIVIVPRKASLGEHRNDHQMATAKWMEGRPGLAVAWEPEELLRLLDRKDALASGHGIPDYASEEFILRLREYLGDPRHGEKKT